jgi:hypothetical protein
VSGVVISASILRHQCRLTQWNIYGCWPGFNRRNSTCVWKGAGIDHKLPSVRKIKERQAITSSNILRLETSGLAMVCLSYFDASSPAHMRYAIRRIRRRLPHARILVGCWRTDTDPTLLRDTSKSDAVATSLREAVKLCLGEAHKSQELPRSALQQPLSSADAA